MTQEHIPPQGSALAGDSAPRRRELARGMLFLVLLVALFHGPSLKNDFVYDDAWTILQNPVLRDPKNLLSLLRRDAARQLVPDAGRPTLLATEILDHALWGLQPRGWHLQNLVWHAGVTALFFAGTAALTGSTLVAITAGALFAVHPLHVETVGAINYREDLLAAFFVLAALLAIGAGRRSGQGQARFRVLAVALLLPGVFAKENASMAPVLLVMVDLFLRSTITLRARLLDYLTLIVPATLAFTWRAWAMGGPGVVSATAEVPAAHRDLLVAVPVATLSFVQGLGQLVIPWRLSPEYSDASAAPFGWIACFAVGAIVALGLYHRRRYPWLALAALAAVAAYVPTFGFVPITNLRADRYFYLASMPLLIGVAFLMRAGLDRFHAVTSFGVPRVALVVGGLVLVLGMRSLRQGRIWRSDLALWTHATTVAADSPRAWTNLADAYLRRGQTMAALSAVNRSLALSDDSHARELRGLVLLRQGHFDGARRELERALLHGEPHHRAELLNNLGYCELQLGRGGAALARFEQAQRLAPRYDRPWLNAARAHLESGHQQRAEATLQRLVEQIPESIDGWKQLAHLLESGGQKGRALSAYRRAATLGASDPETKRAIVRLMSGQSP